MSTFLTISENCSGSFFFDLSLPIRAVFKLIFWPISERCEVRYEGSFYTCAGHFMMPGNETLETGSLATLWFFALESRFIRIINYCRKIAKRTFMHVIHVSLGKCKQLRYAPSLLGGGEGNLTEIFMYPEVFIRN